MASSLSAVFVLALCVLLAPCVSAGDDCEGYKSVFTGIYQSSQKCYYPNFCCGTCNDRYCCTTPSSKFSENAQDDCDQYSIAPFSIRPSPVAGFLTFVITVIVVICVLIIVFILLCCCCCRCCCLYKMCCKRRHVTNSTLPEQYPLQEVTRRGLPPGYQCPTCQATPMQPGYGPLPTVPYQGQPYRPGPPPTYEEATCPAYPPNPMPYSQAAFTPSQTSYPLQPPAQPQVNAPQFNAPPSQTDSFTQPAYNPDYVGPQHKTG